MEVNPRRNGHRKQVMEVKEGLLERGGEEANDNMPGGQGWRKGGKFPILLFVDYLF